MKDPKETSSNFNLTALKKISNCLLRYKLYISQTSLLSYILKYEEKEECVCRPGN